MEGNLPPYFGHALLEKKKRDFLVRRVSCYEPVVRCQQEAGLMA